MTRHMASPSVESRPRGERPTPTTPWRSRAGFAVRSLGRHGVLTISVFVLVAGAVAFTALSVAPVYRSTATVVLRAEVIAGGDTTAARANASHAVEQAARAMEPWLRSSASTRALVGDLGLAARLGEGVGTVGRVWRSTREIVVGPPSERASDAAAQRRVRSGLRVHVLPGGGIEQTVIVTGSWSSARTAQRIATRALERWVEDRRVSELSPLEDAVTVAQGALEDANSQVSDLRQSLGIPEAQDREVPASSPLRTAAAIQAAAAERFGVSRVALAAAKASFDHRVRIVSGADLPSRPAHSPLPWIALGLVVAYLAAMTVTARTDRRRGCVVEVWQVTERLGLTHLAHLGELR